MVKNSKIVNFEEPEEISNDEINDSISDSESEDIELNDKKPRSDKKEKPPKKPYVFTDGRKSAMDKAREIRMKRIEDKKQETEELKREHEERKKALQEFIII